MKKSVLTLVVTAFIFSTSCMTAMQSTSPSQEASADEKGSGFQLPFPIGGQSSSQGSNSGSQQSSGSSTLGDILGAVGSLIGGQEVDMASLHGTWVYADPAISFNSENFLEKAGGVAASQAIVKKLRPYYQKAGIDKLTVTFAEDNTFSVACGVLKASGKVVDLDGGVYEFQFNAFGKVPSGKIKANIQRSITDTSITFDATRLLELVKKIAASSSNSTLQSASKLVESYDGLNIGVKLNKAN